MNIGSFKSSRGQLLGQIATATIDLPRLGLRPVESNSERAPAFEILTLNVGKRWVQIGALWEQTSNATGETFYQGKLDDPSMSEPLQVMLFRGEDEEYRVVWNRPQPRRENLDGSRQARRRATRDDNFGTGNATEDGQIDNGADLDVDEEIPF